MRSAGIILLPHPPTIDGELKDLPQRLATVGKERNSHLLLLVAAALHQTITLFDEAKRNKRRIAYATKLYSKNEKKTGHVKSADVRKLTSREAEILLSECGFGLDTFILVPPDANKLQRPRNSHYQCNGQAQKYTEEVVTDEIDRTRGNKTGNSGERFSETNQALLKSWWNLSSKKKEKKDSTFLVGLVPPTGTS